MLDKPKKLRVFAGSGPLIALAIATAMVLGIAGPSSAQFFNFGGFQQRPQPQRGGGFGGGWFGNDMVEPFQQQAPPQPRRQTLPPVREDFSKAPPPEKRETVPERHILPMMPPAPISRQSLCRRNVRARRTAFTSFASNAGSNSTIKRLKR